MKKAIVKSLILVFALSFSTSMTGEAEELPGAGEGNITEEQGAMTADSLYTHEKTSEDPLNFEDETSEEDPVLEETQDTQGQMPEDDMDTHDETTAVKTGKWIRDRIGWWYAYEDGTWPANEIVEINGIRYGFRRDGYMATGWYLDGADWYYFNADGSMRKGWLLSKGVWYYLDGDHSEKPGLMAADCGMEIGKYTYFFRTSGAMLTGWVLRPEGWYYTNGSGAMLTGWQRVNGKWYYLDPANEEHPGLMAADCKMQIGEHEYYFNKQGAMREGWYKEGEDWYYYDPSGLIASGWRKVNGIWYYLDPENENKMACGGWQEIGGARYYLKSSGAMATNWLKLGNDWYYMGSDGAMKTGWQVINGYKYYFYQEEDPNGGNYGVMAANTTIDGCRIDAGGSAGYALQSRINEIKQYITTPYSYGGTGPGGWDCSGFTQWALNYLGVSIPRTVAQQAAGGVNISKNSRSLWQPGDILVYASGGAYTHVALYLGDGMMMHALNTKYGTLIQGVDYYEQWDPGNQLALVRRYL